MKFRYIIWSIFLLAGIVNERNPVIAQELWNPLPSMPIASGFLGAVPYNGKIYLFGGASPNHTIATNKAFVFNPADSSYQALPDMPRAISSAGVVEVGGKIYVMGGSNAVLGNQIYNTNFIFDPVLLHWDSGTAMPHPRLLFAIATLDKKIYVIGGGVTAVSPTQLVDIYDTEAGIWSGGTALPIPKAFLSAVAVNGKIYLFGGAVDAYGIGLNTVDIYNPVGGGTWSNGKPMPTKRFGATAVVREGEIFVLGGSSLDAPNPFFSTVEAYNPDSNSWRTLPSMLTGARGRAAALVGDNIYAFGGMYLNAGASILSSAAAEVFGAVSYVVESAGGQGKISVLPNPASGLLIFRFEPPVSGQLMLVRSNGVEVYSEKLQNVQERQIELTGLPRGLLLWKFFGQYGNAASGKITVLK